MLMHFASIVSEKWNERNELIKRPGQYILHTFRVTVYIVYHKPGIDLPDTLPALLRFLSRYLPSAQFAQLVMSDLKVVEAKSSASISANNGRTIEYNSDS